MTDITIPPEALEAAARKIAAIKMNLSNNGERLPDDLWQQCLPDARAACLAMLRNWPGMKRSRLGSDGDLRIILPLTQEKTNGN